MMALTPKTNEIFQKIVSLECIQPYVLVGGTALALQIHTRLSEDLDFQSWKSHQTQKQEVDWVNIENQLSTIGIVQNREIWDFDHVEFVVSGVKISFYACPKISPFPDSIPLKGNLRMADIKSIAAMKMGIGNLMFEKFIVNSQ